MVDMKQVFETLPVTGHMLDPQNYSKLLSPMLVWDQRLPDPVSL